MDRSENKITEKGNQQNQNINKCKNARTKFLYLHKGQKPCKGQLQLLQQGHTTLYDLVIITTVATRSHHGV